MLYTQPPKKMLIVHILDILRRYSDADHRLSQKDILEILRREYETEADRKAIKRNLTNLMEAGYPIEYTERIRKNANGDEEIICTDWYLEREFSDSELRLLIDSLLFSKHIPYSQCKELIEKIEVFPVEGTGKDRTQRVIIHYRFVGTLDIPGIIHRPPYILDSRKGVAIEYLSNAV